MAEFVVAHVLDDYRLGDRFSMWPLHVTILPPFEAANLEGVDLLVKSIASKKAPMQLQVNDKTSFSSRVKVQKLVPSRELQDLHLSLLEAVEARGWHINGRYIGAHYTPHITEKSGRSYDRVSFTLDSLAIVENIGQGYRVIRSAIKLSGVAS